MKVTSPPQSHLGKCITTPHGRNGLDAHCMC